MAKKILTKEIALSLKEGLNFEEFLKKEKLTKKDVNVKLEPFYVKAYPVFKEIIEKFENGTNTFHVYLGSGSRSRKVFDLMYNEKTTVYLERKYLKFIK